MRILITGVQGSGKTTQANLLAREKGYDLVKAGDLLREFVKGQGEEEKSTAVLLEKGELVDDRILARLIKKRFDELENSGGIVVDGYPRRMSQMDCFDPNFDKVFNLKISDSLGINRLLKRGRTDDTKEAIEERLRWYHEETEPVIEYFRKRGILIDIDGEREEKEVQEDILRSLGNE